MSSASIVSEMIRFICYDWIFLIYIFVWVVSLIFDFASIVIGGIDIGCLGGVILMVSGIYHLILRSTLIWFFCCICCQVSLSEVAICRPFVAIITCGLIDKESQKDVRERLAAKIA